MPNVRHCPAVARRGTISGVDPRTVAGRFRIVAVAEAVTWVGLLLGMLVKYPLDGGDLGVRVFGPLHGGVFVLYLAVALITWRALRWSLPVGLTALAASIPPLATLVFEMWAVRTGRLGPRASPGG
jgi:integral membrane protein